tara:strand:- start:1667 stop:1828 length:162 start_codon:yes stop_codon:yes gene_type:complete
MDKKKERFIPCSENAQTYNWQRTTKKSSQDHKLKVTGALYKPTTGIRKKVNKK